MWLKYAHLFLSNRQTVEEKTGNQDQDGKPQFSYDGLPVSNNANREISLKTIPEKLRLWFS
jgi:hypothetical protein